MLIDTPTVREIARIDIPSTRRFIITYGFNPSDPLISPIYDDLSGLAPTLVQASGTEMLFDDGARYAAKASSQGSPIMFQSWTNLPHVWQIFDDYVGEAHQALDEIGAFLKDNGVSK